MQMALPRRRRCHPQLPALSSDSPLVCRVAILRGSRLGRARIYRNLHSHRIRFLWQVSQKASLGSGFPTYLYNPYIRQAGSRPL